MKKELRSKFHESGWTALDGTHYEVRCLPLDKLWPYIGPTETLHRKPFLENLTHDIEADGLYFPVLCISISRKKLVAIAREAKQERGKKLSPLPFDAKTDDLSLDQYVIRGGCQRYHAAKNLGYTHIDCAMIPDFLTARRLQGQMREPFKERYYR